MSKVFHNAGIFITVSIGITDMHVDWLNLTGKRKAKEKVTQWLNNQPPLMSNTDDVTVDQLEVCDTDVGQQLVTDLSTTDAFTVGQLAVTDYPWDRWCICPRPRRFWIAPRPRRNALGPGGLGLPPWPWRPWIMIYGPWSQLSIKPTPGQLGASATAKVRPCDAARVKEYNEY